ncbi:MAG: M28 family peptidase [Vicinamibacterales bacterium]
MFHVFTDPDLEAAAKAAIRLDEPRHLLDTFITLVRESGTPDEDTAARYLVERLQSLGIPVTLHTPDLYISLPVRAELTIGGIRSLTARPPAMARSTGDDQPVEGEICYIPSRYAAGTASLFDVPDAALRLGSGQARGGGVSGPDPVAGRIVLTEGFSMPGPVQAFERRGAIAQIYIHPGDRIHEGICTSIWGAPTLESIGRKPTTPVVCINRPSGESLIAEIERGPVRASIRTWLREGWMRCLLPVVDIPGQEDPDEFLLVHGHYDSWYEGIGDNATGDAALLELARVLWSLRDRLKRSVRIAWWPGHSTGRYAGSTWYADTFADEIDEHCIAQLDIDSPGCADATAYEEVMWMAEADHLCQSAIRDALDLPSTRVRPLRAGDYSFNQIGPTGLYMLLSNIPQEERQRRGYYAVGGCGGNTAWHTPDDLMPVADLEILRRDLAVYLTTIIRILNAPLHPFDYAATIDEIQATVEQYQTAAQGEIDLSPILHDLHQLRDEIREWQADALERATGRGDKPSGLSVPLDRPKGLSPHTEKRGDKPLGLSAPLDRPKGLSPHAERQRLNAVLRKIARLLVPLNYARGERFDHDPALKFGAVPRLEAAASLPSISPELKPFLKVGLTREINKVRASIRAVRRELRF